MKKMNVYIDPNISYFKLSELYKIRSISKFENPCGKISEDELQNQKESDKYIEITGKDIIFTDGELADTSILNKEEGKIDYAVNLNNFNYVIVVSIKKKFLHFSNGGGIFYVVDDIVVYQNTKDKINKKNIKNVINQIYNNAKMVYKGDICYFNFNNLINLYNTNCISNYNDLNNSYSRIMTK